MSAVLDKQSLRKSLRTARREHAAAQPAAIRALLFNRPPAPLMDIIAPNAAIGLYHASASEAPTSGYAKFFQEAGHTLALPRFADENAPMHFAEFTDPFEESDLEKGAFGMMQPAAEALEVAPTVLFMPLVGFTADGARLGQGGGHYDRYCAEHSQALRIGLAWDVQLCEALPTEPHDMPLHAIVTPTRMYGPFNA
nr:5-formyltetrahydrofolate cyclo-ligase [Altererythrobacter lutimaris]